MRRNRTAYSLLVYALLIDALVVFAMQSVRWRGAWIFVALYWAILAAKNAVDWGNHNERKTRADNERTGRRVAPGGRVRQNPRLYDDARGCGGVGNADEHGGEHD